MLLLKRFVIHSRRDFSEILMIVVHGVEFLLMCKCRCIYSVGINAISYNSINAMRKKVVIPRHQQTDPNLIYLCTSYSICLFIFSNRIL
jgi:hypothetical protein